MHVLSFLLLCTCLPLVGGSCAFAQGASQQTASQAAQSVVARLSLLEGTAQVASAAGNVEPIDAALNMSLWAGQTLQTSPHGAAEVEFADGSVLRLTESSSATLVRLQTEAQIGLGDGLFYFELRATDNPQFSVFAGDVSVVPTENASFRIRLSNGQAEIAVLSGAVSVTHPNAYTVDLQSGESLRTDAKNNRRYFLSDGIAQETWDNWNEHRAQTLLDESASQTVARNDYAADQGYGWSDLDANGTWYAMPGEGMVWQPYGIDSTFDPYAYGSWVYGPAGYTWASAYGWGWVPYHCGEWRFLAGPGWFWIPSAGCRSYGSGWYGTGWQGGGGHGPRGWRPPHPPPLPHQVAGSSGIHIKPPTIPVRPIDGPPLAGVTAPGGMRRVKPVQVGDVMLRPLAPIRQPRISQGGSAIGSAFRRDFPVQNGTHQPLVGQEGSGAIALPGRADWHRAPGRPITAGVQGTSPAATGPPARNDAPAASGDTGFSSWHRAGADHGRYDSAAPLSTLSNGSATTPTNAQGAPPTGANGPAVTGATGPAPLGANGPVPVQATGSPIRSQRDPRDSVPVHTFGGAGATPYPSQPAHPILRAPEVPSPVRVAPVAPIAPAPRIMPAPPPAPSPRVAAPAPAPQMQPQIRMAPAPVSPAPASRPNSK